MFAPSSPHTVRGDGYATQASEVGRADCAAGFNANVAFSRPYGDVELLAAIMRLVPRWVVCLHSDANIYISQNPGRKQQHASHHRACVCVSTTARDSESPSHYIDTQLLVDILIQR